MELIRNLPATPTTGLPTGHPLRLGTDLGLCRGSRHIRVLSLPNKCHRKILLNWWEDSFGDSGLVMWPPPLGTTGTHLARPSAN